MANEFATPEVLLPVWLAHFENQQKMATAINKDFGDEFGTIGDSFEIFRAPRLEMLEGNRDFNLMESDYQDLIEGKHRVTLDQELSLKPFKIPVKMRTFDINDSRVQRFIKNGIVPMAERVETAVGATYRHVWNTSGAPGTPITTREQLGKAEAKMFELGVPQDETWVTFHDGFTADKLVDIITGQFDDSNATDALRNSAIGRIGMSDHFRTVHIPHHVVGNHGGTPLVNGGSQDVAYTTVKDTNQQTLVTDGWTNSVNNLLNEGDIFTIAGVNSVNPVTKKDTGMLQEFVVRAAADSDGAGNSTITIAPAIVTTGAYQNVTAAPADNAAITVKGGAGKKYRQSLMFQRDFATLVSRQLEIVTGGSYQTFTKSGNRMSLSLSVSGEFHSLNTLYRCDGIYKVDPTDPARAIRQWGAEVL